MSVFEVRNFRNLFLGWEEISKLLRPWFSGNFPVSRLQLSQTVGCYYNWVKYFAPLDFRDPSDYS